MTMALEYDDNRWCASERSPLAIAEPYSGAAILEYLMTENFNGNNKGALDIVTRLQQTELIRIFTLPTANGIAFYDYLLVKNKTVFKDKRELMGAYAKLTDAQFLIQPAVTVLNPKAQAVVKHVDHNEKTIAAPTQTKEEREKEKAELECGPRIELRDKLFTKGNKSVRELNFSAKPVVLTTTLCQFPLKSGTKDSLDFHAALYMLATDNKIFEGEAIRAFLLYKSQQAMPIYIIYSLPYLAFMFFITYSLGHGVFEYWVMVCFTVLQILMLASDIHRRGPQVCAGAAYIMDEIRLVF